jgi:hypothetical protein
MPIEKTQLSNCNQQEENVTEDNQYAQEILSKLHPTLRKSFTALPDDAPLSKQQLRALFGGDLKALRDLLKFSSGDQ